jgi:competence protein ComEA
VARRSDLFALAVIVCGLALAALARLPRESGSQGAQPNASLASAHARARSHANGPASDAALRALRDARPLDLNTAVAADLELLPGVGPALAQRIVAYRSEHGAFADVDALGKVRGIGPKTLERLRPLVAAVPRH